MKKTIRKFFTGIFMCGLVSHLSPVAAQNCVFEEKNGVLTVEAEAYSKQEKTTHRYWYTHTGTSTGAPTPDPDPKHFNGASGGAYLELLPDTRVTHSDPLVQGVSFSNTPGEACVLSYPVYFNETGKYFVWVRAYSTGSEDNGIHVGLDDTWPSSGARMQWCSGKNAWTWESKQRTDANHCGEPQKIFLNITTPGYHTIKFSMREDGFEFDKFVLSKAYTKPSGSGPAVNEKDCDDVVGNPEGEEGNTPAGVALDGELRRWHKVTLTCDGPSTSETAATNPFMNYRFDATFTHESGVSFVVPGYYAACGNPEEGCSSGNKWKVHFAPNLTGAWTYSLSFTTGNKVAINGGGSGAGFFNGKSGDFTIGESNKTGRDFRAANKGQLRYVGEHYLQFAGTGGNTPNGDFFVKAGADAPENTLAYNDFDATPNRGNRRKTWQPHQQDYVASEASQYTWGNGKGTELLGVVNYLSSKGVNAFSFLTLSLHGDDENVFPHLLKVSESTYNGYNDAQQWNSGVHHDRFDVSKMAQWERIFQYADQKGMFLHFKTLETENDNIMDGDNFGDERKIYYRELIARFAHHMALNWNLTEESTLKDITVKQTAAYIKAVDPYDHHRVLHTYPNQQTQRYTPQLGSNSELTGASIQIDKLKVHDAIIEWRNKSANAGKKWVVANDEQGSANIGVDVDGKEDKLVRHRVLWGTFIAGGMGVEYYYGYQTAATDLNLQDHRTRDGKYEDAAHALKFMETYLIDHVTQMEPNDGVTADNGDYVLAKPGEVYAVYRPNGGSTTISLPAGNWTVQWYNPRTGGGLSSGVAVNGSITAPDNNDWVALITNDGGVTTNTPPVVSFANPTSTAVFQEGASLGVTINATDTDGTVESVALYLNNTLVRTENIAPYTWGEDNSEQTDAALLNLAAGMYTLKAVATDNEGATTERTLTIEVTEKGLVNLSPINDAYIQGAGGTNFNTADLRVEANNRTTFLMFDISGLPSGSLTKAELELTVGSDNGNGTINVYAAGNGWNETTINGGNAPAKGALITSLNSTYALSTTYKFDVASADFSGNQVSFILEMTGGNDVAFASKEHSSVAPPKLVIKVDEDQQPEDCAGVPGGTASIDACGVCSGGTTGVEPSSPQTWYADADGDGAGDPAVTLEDCDQPAGYVATAGDQCPADGAKVVPGECGCGVVEGTCNQDPETVTLVNPAASFDEGTTTFPFEVAYAANETREVFIEIRNPANDWLGGTFNTVQAGTGTTVVTLALAANQVPAGEGYKVHAHIRPVGTNWQSQFDNDQAIFDIIAVQQEDCAGVPGGTASLDACGICSGGTTGVEPSSPQTWYEDTDGDGVGDANASVEDCDQPAGYVAIAGDECPSDGNKIATGECGCGVAEGTCDGDECNDATPYSSTAIYDEPMTKVIYEGKLYQNRWYASGNTPGTSNGPWELIAFCGAAPLDCSNIPVWNSDTRYTNSGTVVKYNGNQYSNRYWSRNQEPGVDEVWQLEGPCTEATAKYGVSMTEIQAVPNPFVNTTYLQATGNAKATVFDMNGQIVEEIQFSGSVEIGENWPLGVYTILINDGASVNRMKVVKQ